MTLTLVSQLDANSNKIINLANPTAAGDAVNFSTLNAAIEGLSWKDNVRVASTANVTVSGPGTTIDGVTLATNDRVLLKSQTTASENGLYIFNGSAVAMTRALDASTGPELVNATVSVDEGTANAGTVWRQTAVNITIGTTSVTFIAFGTVSPAASETTAGIAEIATQAETDAGTDDLRFITPLKLATYSGRVRKFMQTFGDGSATSYNIDHNLNNFDVHVQVCKTAGNKDVVIVDTTFPTVNRVTLVFGAAPATNAYRAIIIG